MAYNGNSTPEDRLARVRDMIEKVLSGAQEYAVASSRARYPSLAELMRLEEWLVGLVNAESQGNPLTVGARVPPT